MFIARGKNKNHRHVQSPATGGQEFISGCWCYKYLAPNGAKTDGRLFQADTTRLENRKCSGINNARARTWRRRRGLGFPVILRTAILSGFLPDQKCLRANNRATVNRDQAGGRIDVEGNRALQTRRGITIRKVARTQSGIVLRRRLWPRRWFGRERLRQSSRLSLRVLSGSFAIDLGRGLLRHVVNCVCVFSRQCPANKKLRSFGDRLCLCQLSCSWIDISLLDAFRHLPVSGPLGVSIKRRAHEIGPDGKRRCSAG
jgi:hypothetical protein